MPDRGFIESSYRRPTLSSPVPSEGVPVTSGSVEAGTPDLPQRSGMSLENAQSTVVHEGVAVGYRGFLPVLPAKGSGGEVSSRSKSSAWKYTRIESVCTSLATLGVSTHVSARFA